ncbi:hypothetical protein MUP37_03315 [Candidatus Bathyarchaeota archaeon]|nr:hypothetical protein [Candidatus Bathyarchaeota archaeon]
MPKFNIKDVRAVYVLVFGIVFIASIAPVALPLPVQQMVKDFYNVMTTGVTVSFASPPRVFTGVKAGTRVLIVNSGEISKLWGDMSESTTIVWRQLMNAGAHIFLWSADPGAQSILDSYLLPRMYGTNPKANALYGTQFVDLGYVAGGSGVLEAWRFDLKGLTPTDRYGTPISNLPMMSNFNALKTDCDLMIGLDARSLETIFVVRDNTPVLEIGGTGSASYLALSYTGGYFKGCLFGQIAGAQYQVLSGLPGNALSYAEMMILLGTAMIIMMVVFNIRYRMNMGKETPKQEAKK